MKKAIVCTALTVAALAATFANEGEEAAFRGTWRTTGAVAPTAITRLSFTPSADGSAVGVVGELSRGDAKVGFQAQAPIQGDTVDFTAALGRTGFLAKLDGAKGAPITLTA